MRWLVLVSCVAAVSLAGCGTGRDGACDVWGRVTYAGEAVGDGAVYFVAPDSEQVLGFSKITGGRYQAAVMPGRARVRITADRVVSGKKNEVGNALIEQYIPARFNESTGLEATISASQRLDWSLPDSE